MVQIPRYWAREYGYPPTGRPARVDVWGWSDHSEADARSVARSRLEEVISRAEREGGLSRSAEYYPRVPLREPVLERLDDGEGDVLAVITRNRYGADVLNTDRVVFADVDVPEWEESEPGSGGGLFRRRTVSVEDAVAGVEPTLQRCGLPWRIYRTRAGLRVLVSGPDLAPGSERAGDLLTALRSDPLYVQLSNTYDSYRARLTPKPWRVGLRALPSRARQVEGAAVADVDQRWLAEYVHVTRGFAVCRLVRSGGAVMAAPARRLVEAHDRRTRVASTGLPLA